MGTYLEEIHQVQTLVMADHDGVPFSKQLTACVFMYCIRVAPWMQMLSMQLRLSRMCIMVVVANPLVDNYTYRKKRMHQAPPGTTLPTTITATMSLDYDSTPSQKVKLRSLCNDYTADCQPVSPTCKHHTSVSVSPIPPTDLPKMESSCLSHTWPSP